MFDEINPHERGEMVLRLAGEPVVHVVLVHLSADLFRQRKDTITKTELVIFLRPVVIRDPSIDGDYRRLRDLIPDADYLRRSNPGKAGAYGDLPSQ